MKKRHAHILICLVLGAVTTVGVAWACNSFISLRAAESIKGKATINDAEWEVTVKSSPGKARVTVASYPHPRGTCGFARAWREPQPALQDVSLPGWNEIQRSAKGDFTPPVADACGWPALALRCEYKPAVRLISASLSDTRADAATRRRMAEIVGDWTSGAIVIDAEKFLLLPYKVIWAGFVVDSAAFGGLWAFLLFGVGATRRALRTRRGHCPMCAYDLRGRRRQPGWKPDVPSRLPRMRVEQNAHT